MTSGFAAAGGICLGFVLKFICDLAWLGVIGVRRRRRRYH